MFVKNAYVNAIWAALAPMLAFSDVPETAEIQHESESMLEVKFELLTEHSQDEVSVNWYSCDDTNKANPRRVTSYEGTSLYVDSNQEPGKYYYFAKITAAGATTAETRVCEVTITEN